MTPDGRSMAARSAVDRQVHHARRRVGGDAAAARGGLMRRSRPTRRSTNDGPLELPPTGSTSTTTRPRSPTVGWSPAFVNTAIILDGLDRGHDHHRIDDGLRDRPLPLPLPPIVIVAVPARHAGAGRHHAGRHVPDRQLLRPVRHPVGGDRALHRHRHHVDLHLPAVHPRRSRCRSTRRPHRRRRLRSGSTAAIILPLLKPAIATVVIIKGVAIYNDFYIPFLYMPSPATSA